MRPIEQPGHRANAQPDTTTNTTDRHAHAHARKAARSTHPNRDRHRANPDADCRQGYIDGVKANAAPPSNPTAGAGYTDGYSGEHCDAVRPRK